MTQPASLPVPDLANDATRKMQIPFRQTAPQASSAAVDESFDVVKKPYRDRKSARPASQRHAKAIK